MRIIYLMNVKKKLKKNDNSVSVLSRKLMPRKNSGIAQKKLFPSILSIELNILPEPLTPIYRYVGRGLERNPNPMDQG